MKGNKMLLLSILAIIIVTITGAIALNQETLTEGILFLLIILQFILAVYAAIFILIS